MSIGIGGGCSILAFSVLTSATRKLFILVYLRLKSRKNWDLVMDWRVAINSDLAGMYILAEKASHPLPTSTICKGV